MQKNPNNPIGVFDSGVGGLTVLKEIIKELPDENIIYFGDTARVPYGPRSSDTVVKYTFQSINFLLEKGIKAIVIACNTASARSLEKARERYNVPILGVIEPGARTAVGTTKNSKIGVIGTEGTIGSKAYDNFMLKSNSELEIFSKPCPLFVPIVEEGWSDTDIAYLTAQKYLLELRKTGIDTLVMGCTHYPLLNNTIQKVMGDEVTLVNPARETAKDLRELLEKEEMLNVSENSPYFRYYVSDQPSKFIKIGEQFLNRKIEKIEMIEIQKY